MHVVPRIMRQPEAFLDPQNAPKSLATGASPQTPLGGAYSAPPRPPSWIQGVLLLRGGEGKEGEKEEGRGGQGRGGFASSWNYLWLRPWWPWVTLPMTRSNARSLCDSWASCSLMLLTNSQTSLQTRVTEDNTLQGITGRVKIWVARQRYWGWTNQLFSCIYKVQCSAILSCLSNNTVTLKYALGVRGLAAFDRS